MHLGEAGMDQQSWGVGQEVDMGTDLPDDTRALLMYGSPSIDLVERIPSLRMPADKLSEERER
jgi:hypothetical protein